MSEEQLEALYPEVYGEEAASSGMSIFRPYEVQQ